MATIELELDESTLEQARRLAESRQYTLEEFLKELIEQLDTAETTEDPFLGMFRAEPELVDQVVTSAMAGREAHPLRQSGA